jgi:hypothetical protein
MTKRHTPDWDDQLALKIEYANLLQRLNAHNKRVAIARKAGFSEHHVPRLSLRHLNSWARAYNTGTPPVRRILAGRKTGKVAA